MARGDCVGVGNRSNASVEKFCCVRRQPLCLMKGTGSEIDYTAAT